MRHFDQMEPDDIARVSGITPAAARGRIPAPGAAERKSGITILIDLSFDNSKIDYARESMGPSGPWRPRAHVLEGLANPPGSTQSGRWELEVGTRELCGFPSDADAAPVMVAPPYTTHHPEIYAPEMAFSPSTSGWWSGKIHIRCLSPSGGTYDRRGSASSRQILRRSALNIQDFDEPSGTKSGGLADGPLPGSRAIRPYLESSLPRTGLSPAETSTRAWRSSSRRSPADSRAARRLTSMS